MNIGILSVVSGVLGVTNIEYEFAELYCRTDDVDFANTPEEVQFLYTPPKGDNIT